MKAPMTMALFITALTACTDGSPEPADDDVLMVPVLDPGSHHWQQSPIDSGHAVIRAAEDWAQMWPDGVAPALSEAVNFRRHMIVVVAQGYRGGGTITRIVRATARDDTLVVVSEERSSCLGYGLWIRPWHAVAVPRMDAEVVFVDGGDWQEQC